MLSERCVKNVSSRRHVKFLKLEDRSVCTVHRFACVGSGDRIRITPSSVHVETKDGAVQVTPIFNHCQRINIYGDKYVDIQTKEIETLGELEAYEALSQYHYRNEDGFGRRSILLMTSSDSSLPFYLGFIEITTPFMNLRNRTEFLNKPFTHPARTISSRVIEWDSWDKLTRESYLHAIARISRVVVHPEVRGLGLSKHIVDAAEVYCRTRWHSKQTRALFMEITADMLKFTPFVLSSNMYYIGQSGGNLERVHRDMKYLRKIRQNPDRGTHWINRSSGDDQTKGIATKQRKDIDNFLSMEEEFENAGRDILSDLESVTRDEAMPSWVYEKLLPFLRYPKPTYLKGLTEQSQGWVVGRQSEIEDLKTYVPRGVGRDISECIEPLRVRNLSLRYSIDTGDLGDSNPGSVRRAFGLDRSFSFRTGLTSLNFSLTAGQICYVYGPSGSGKTSLLNLISDYGKYKNVGEVDGEVKMPSNAKIGTLMHDFSDKPLINEIGNGYSLMESISALNASGLSEPRLYLSNFSQLSSGQQYRAQLARLMCSDVNIWILDEFASNLDDATALSIGRNFSKVVKRKGVICIIASVRKLPLIEAISPDLLVSLSQVSKPDIKNK